MAINLNQGVYSLCNMLKHDFNHFLSRWIMNPYSHIYNSPETIFPLLQKGPPFEGAWASPPRGLPIPRHRTHNTTTCPIWTTTTTPSAPAWNNLELSCLPGANWQPIFHGWLWTLQWVVSSQVCCQLRRPCSGISRLWLLEINMRLFQEANESAELYWKERRQNFFKASFPKLLNLQYRNA